MCDGKGVVSPAVWGVTLNDAGGSEWVTVYILGMLSTAISQAASFLVSFIDGAETRMEEEAIAKIIRAANTSSVLVFIQ